MKTADEMFEELGYKVSTNEDITYEVSTGEEVVIAYIKERLFNGIKEKTYTVYDSFVFYKNKEYDRTKHISLVVVGGEINIKEHQAITQKMKELGWLE